MSSSYTSRSPSPIASVSTWTPTGRGLLEFLIDVYFWIDLRLGFFLAYWEPTHDEDYRYVVDLSKIQSEYLRSWFAVDLFGVHPREPHLAEHPESDDVFVALESIRAADRCVALSSSQRAALHFFAALRLLKLLRIFGAVRVLKR